ncbi:MULTISPECIES: NADP-dependent oxidoreductase [Mycobacterium]|uniref:NADPH:quinone reductase n=1 Tax=Mycobacterium kiyosense TaxID=2871094 RepID=A0A9P3UV89_9MYCO|nr:MULTISPECIES: NADP-dependent oxidoreductase [Mycobacterium]BDB42369.1 NADPH:quinone reductase [Mycobacterium kiyosense]BDE14361.1 NADPH:quinone reductase [Mycobacterium sp. 20KCMC460]GLB83296.1 NADPH:quinone reductase [Mycobacterium kiyosense]GLB91200.1 NADPH:quinone reductase [Mycobacterium kiyosense]GLB98532.1 NADPH:quinone reductase [Mycobacterium kiyosense]
MVKAFGYNSNGGPEVQEFLDLEMPSPLSGELLVEVRAAGVNPVDWKIRSGMLGAANPSDLPGVLGSEVSGVVREVGQDVEGFSVNDEVFGSVAPGSGGYAEYTPVTATAAAPKPPQVSFNEAATLPVAAATAYDGVTQLNLTAGQTLLINGISGGVGVAAAQIARDAGINVVGTASEDKRALVESLGATLVPYGDGVAERIRQILPDGVDAILDLAGGDGLLAVAELLSNRDNLITATDPETAQKLGGRMIERDRTCRVLEIVAKLVADGKLDPHIQDVRPLDEAADAVAAVEKGHAMGKVVIEVST